VELQRNGQDVLVSIQHSHQHRGRGRRRLDQLPEATYQPWPGGAIMCACRMNSLSWPEVAARLAAARSYWLCTTMPSGASHAAPVWGVVLNYTLCLYSERRTIKACNLAADPRVVVHLQSAEDVLIVRGAAEDLGTPAQVPEVVAALSAKFTRKEDRQNLPDSDPDFDVIYAIRPQPAVGLPRDIRPRSACHTGDGWGQRTSVYWLRSSCTTLV
jgi:hypothetical protein